MHWLIDSWRTRLPSAAANALLAVVAVLCGGIVGAEGERREKPAGLRTLILVCLGSTFFTMSSFIFNTASGDSGRVAAQIVTGIGFLGAGAILYGRGMVVPVEVVVEMMGRKIVASADGFSYGRNDAVGPINPENIPPDL